MWILCFSFIFFGEGCIRGRDLKRSLNCENVNFLWVVRLRKAAILVYISRMPTAGFRKIFSGAFDPCLMARQRRYKLRQKGGGHWELVWFFLDRTFGFMFQILRYWTWISVPRILIIFVKRKIIKFHSEKS